MIVVVFRARARKDPGEDSARLGERMEQIVNAMPGFISARSYSAADGEELTVVEFESEETLAAWRDHPEHKAAQQAGRDWFFESYRIQVCSLIRDASFEHAPARAL
jgi:heme-degrading monooxygenase HmoA